MSIIKACIADTYQIEIPSLISHYQFVKFIGNGAFSVVALVVNKLDGQQYACKIASRQQLIEMNTFPRFELEVRIMQSLNHPNLVHLYDVVFDDNLIYLILEYCENGELFQYLAEHGKLDEEPARQLFRELVEGMSYIHQRGIAHRDLKPENILLDSDLHPKIADFGLCHLTNSKVLLSTPCGSPFYAPPEVIKNQEYDGKACDVWSVGIVLFTIVTGCLPWRELNQTALFVEIQKAEIAIPLYLSPELRDLISQLIQVDPAARPTMEQILAHPWLCQESQDDSIIQKHQSFIQPQYRQRRPSGSIEIQHKSIIVRPKVPVQKQSMSAKSPLNPVIQHLIRKVPPSHR